MRWRLGVPASRYCLRRRAVPRTDSRALEPPAGQIDPRALLRWNRGLPHARFAETGSGDVWVEADLALEAVTPERLDGFLGLFVRVATQARERVG